MGAQTGKRKCLGCSNKRRLDLDNLKCATCNGRTGVEKGCGVAGCEAAHEARGFCQQHYNNLYRHGDPLGLNARPQYSRTPDPEYGGLPENVWRRILPTGSCWQWTGPIGSDGYAHVHTKSDGARIVHRVVYEFLVGPIPDGLQLDHLCRNRSCVNPDHLDPVTPRENTLRSWGATAINARKTHCIRGHELTQGKSQRYCLTCQRDRYRQKRKAS